jgi:CheY-like chemotaxis protein
MLNKQIILLVEDDPNDVLLIQRAFQKAGLQNSLRIVRNGDEAIEYLSGENSYSDRERFPLPFLVLLDLKMPGTDGFEVLSWARSISNLKRLLMVVLTSSNLQSDVDKAYELGANSYLVKPVEFDDMVNLIKRFEVYWTEINRTPTTPKGPLPVQPETILG